MIINISRVKTLTSCKMLTLNKYHRHLEGLRNMNLVDGGAFHDGVAKGMATKNWDAALDAARARFEKDLEQASIPPEQAFLREEHWKLVEKMIETYRTHWGEVNYLVIQPECEFDVRLPGEPHNCIFVHWQDNETNKEYWGEPPVEMILQGRVESPHDPATYPRQARECRCYLPHRFVGKTDNIISWNHMLWLQEQKTTAISGMQFWNQWLLDIQLTGYCYGVWKVLGVRPHGVILNAIMKPSEAQVSSYNARRKSGPDKAQADYIGFQREPFLRSEEDLWRFERELVAYCDEWESRIISGQWPHEGFANRACMSYNRLCDFHTACSAHDDAASLNAMSTRAKDYVDVKLDEILNSPKKETT